MSAALTVRPLCHDDGAASTKLGREAFGHSGEIPPLPEIWPAPGDHTVGAFLPAASGDELIGKIVGRGYGTHFGDAEVPTWAIAGVTVAAEHRGRGALTALFEASFTEARQRGAAISTLFPTAPGIYRRFGYEIVGGFVIREINSAELVTVSAPQGVSVRRATVADVPAMREVYRRWATQQDGLLTRVQQGVTETDDELLAQQDAFTLAFDEQGTMIGYAAWDRGAGYDGAATISVDELIALTPDAASALWSAIGSFRTVSGRIHVLASPLDVHRFVLPSGTWREVRRTDYMLAVLDVCEAFALRSTAPGITAQLPFAVTDHPLADQRGGYLLTCAGGAVTVTRQDVGPDLQHFTARGLALAYSGTQSMANLRIAGLLTGGDPALDATWDLLGGGRQFHVHDYF